MMLTLIRNPLKQVLIRNYPSISGIKEINKADNEMIPPSPHPTTQTQPHAHPLTCLRGRLHNPARWSPLHQ